VPRRGGAQPIPRPADARPGGPAPWTSTPDVDRVITFESLRSAFRGRVGAAPGGGERPKGRASAVLAPFYDHDGELNLILIRRGLRMRSHRGEVAFPGGARERGESLTDAALRETEEEIGLDVTTVDVLGELDYLTTVGSRSYIAPFVGVLAGGRPVLRPNPMEVDAVLHVPVSELLLDEVYREERWTWDGVDRSIFFFELVGDTVWGATAAMLRQLLALALGIPASIEHA
jgi:8-oxo-dGTP pyrophosphatase MutT (NUDIX family)